MKRKSFIFCTFLKPTTTIPTIHIASNAFCSSNLPFPGITSNRKNDSIYGNKSYELTTNVTYGMLIGIKILIAPNNKRDIKAVVVYLAR
jgi:hypothetical protein